MGDEDAAARRDAATVVTLKLAATRLAPKEPICGLVTVTRPLRGATLRALAVRLVRASPNAQAQVVLEHVIARDDELRAGSSREYGFEFWLPSRLAPTSRTFTYRVEAAVRVDGAPRELRDASDLRFERSPLDLDAIVARWPGLVDADEAARLAALDGLAAAMANENLSAAESILTWLMRVGTRPVRLRAVGVWAAVLEGRPRPRARIDESVGALWRMLSAPGRDRAIVRAVASAAARLADRGAAALLGELARDADPAVRSDVADEIYFARRDDHARSMLLDLAADRDAGVRAAAQRALAAFAGDREIVRLAGQRLDVDPSVDVLEACVWTLAAACDRGHGALALASIERHVASPHLIVRKAIAEHLDRLPRGPRLEMIARRLLHDRSEKVRRTAEAHVRDYARGAHEVYSS